MSKIKYDIERGIALVPVELGYVPLLTDFYKTEEDLLAGVHKNSLTTPKEKVDIMELQTREEYERARDE